MAKKKTVLRESFDKHLDGVYGISKTMDSYKIDFLSTSMKIDKAVSQLRTALDELEFEELTFDEIIQRDIDEDRVKKKIIGEYLEKSHNEVIFFPPLVVSLVEIQNGVPVPNYPKPIYEKKENYNEWGPAIIKKWGNLFRAVYLIEEDTSTDWMLEYKDEDDKEQKVHYANFNVSLDYDSNHIKLIVVDGQHRLKALQKLYKKSPDHIKDMDVPLCIFFPSNATVEDGAETVVGDMRKCFVKINNEAQKVSGHFRDLLDDNRISCAIVRGLANNWKEKSKGSGKSKSQLHLLEWNQRQDSKANQRNVEYSITTVKILTDVFDKSILKGPNLGILLNSRSKQLELDAAGEKIKYDDITNEKFEPAQVPIIQELIEKYIVPSLDCLLRKPTPYSNLELCLNEKLSELNDRAKESAAARSFQKRLFEFRKQTEEDRIDTPESCELEKKFVEDIEKEIKNDDIYFKNVFQTGFLILWSDICLKLTTKFSIAPQEVADAMVSALNKFCFDYTHKVFHPDSSYTQDLLFTGTKINTQEFSKKGYKNLIAVTLLEDESMNEFNSHFADSNIHDEMKRLCVNAFENYKEDLWKRKTTMMMNSWKYDPTLPEKVRNKLMEETNKDKQKQICVDYVEEDLNKCISDLESMIDKKI
jgi:hypothetical protein